MQIYQLHVALKDIKPDIWRRIEVPTSIKLGKLHDVLQDAIGWEDSHLHEFRIGGRSYGMPTEGPFDQDIHDERRVRLDSVAGVGDTFEYEYDFGDSWQHVIKIEKVVPSIKGVAYPRCIAGARACPPEDCGGVYGYANLVEVMSDPKHKERGEMLDWLGYEFDPEAFELDRASD